MTGADGPPPGIPPEHPARRRAVPPSPGLVADSVIAIPLRELMDDAGDRPIGVLIELRTSFPGGAGAAASRVEELIAEVGGDGVRRVGSYVAAALTAPQIRDLARLDARQAEQDTGAAGAPRSSVHRIWPNFEVRADTYRSVVTTKCAAAHRAFGAHGQDIVWAVLDSGIERDHPHFDRHDNLRRDADDLPHRSFVPGADDADALRDAYGHGTHVAAIIAGERLRGDGAPRSGRRRAAQPIVAAGWYQDDDQEGGLEVRRLELDAISGMAPRCRLLSCKVLRDDGTGDVAAVLDALRYLQELNSHGRDLRVHGVNLSVGYPFDPRWFAAGLTPVCREVDLLVRSGVVVVVSAGNTGYGFAVDAESRSVGMGLDLTINDPGNADLAITVGSTSCRPYVTGVSYFSSKGPTGDGRQKPDLVAPGERIISAGAGAMLKRAMRSVPDAAYVEDSGTSMAAPHVSGVAAAFLSVHREFVGRPEEVKRHLMESASDLRRDRAFQGSGLVDAMRAIQRV
ncbi:S8 family peptidase [Nonomuraea sp. NN258]|uniref:S8 family peptidase n=1 Tax=Nonomuraea antri TaxID=2730852 RepID=UPI00156804EB|nr:S8 family peptidase [Nonomuraea antri]NRQ32172.1 S8 family peptidase [Nonomuraea antri]